LITIAVSFACGQGSGLEKARLGAHIVRMTMHTPRLLTKEELASLIEFAVTADSQMPPAHLAKLVALGYVLETAKGPVVTGDGLMRITEGE
jgi:hypothetical protein